jgi:hypothetical protein
VVNGKSLAVVLPAYNSARTLTATVRELPDIVDIRILVDDGSSDETPRLAAGYGRSRLVTAMASMIAYDVYDFPIFTPTARRLAGPASQVQRRDQSTGRRGR